MWTVFSLLAPNAWHGFSAVSTAGRALVAAENSLLPLLLSTGVSEPSQTQVPPSPGCPVQMPAAASDLAAAGWALTTASPGWAICSTTLGTQETTSFPSANLLWRTQLRSSPEGMCRARCIGQGGEGSHSSLRCLDFVFNGVCGVPLCGCMTD